MLTSIKEDLERIILRLGIEHQKEVRLCTQSGGMKWINTNLIGSHLILILSLMSSESQV